MVTDDSRNYAAGIQDAGLSGQQCVVHMKRALGRACGRLSKTTRIRFKALFAQLSEMVKQLPLDGGQRLLEWSKDRRLPYEPRWPVTHLLVKMSVWE